MCSVVAMMLPNIVNEVFERVSSVPGYISAERDTGDVARLSEWRTSKSSCEAQAITQLPEV